MATDAGRDVLGLAREVTGRVDVTGTTQVRNDATERIVHDPRLARAIERVLEEVKEVRAVLSRALAVLERKL